MATSTNVVGYKTTIPGLLTFDISCVEDERGYFQEKFQKEKLVSAGMPDNFQIVQNSVSYNKQAGVTRGLHAEPWDKYISVITGKVFAAYVDLREGDNFGRIITVEITPTKSVYLPQGVANSFQTLTDNVYYIYSVNKHWSADDYNKYCFVNLGDAELAIEWPIPLEQAILAERDINHPPLTQVKPMKV